MQPGLVSTIRSPDLSGIWIPHCITRVERSLFSFLELTCPEGFETLKNRCIENSEKLVREACQDPSHRTRIVAQIFDDLSDELCRVADMAEFVRLAHPNPKMAKAAEGKFVF